ncbi:Ligand of Numb protein X 2 [Colletotrichum sidae]|uniref:Ligand of Numb protein X 2 n=1 Tax=Colletotrichum sidae TaxID=1347389 RepID=A0A4R8T6S7_9PEZI|nr:Ligand of Numb protein X 2 [Colletotrichum sidae]
MSQPGFTPQSQGDATITHLVHNLVEEAVRSVEGVTIPLTPRASPTQWPVEELVTREAFRYSLTTDTVRELLDFSALNYPDEPDDNLVCPICKLPVVTPVITPCDHTFCLECLKRHFFSADTCPIDRTRFRAKDCKTSRLLTNILDSLVVNCPNLERGCEETMKREEVVKHAIGCRYTLHDCPEKTCNKKVEQWLTASGKCWHFEQKCEYCEEEMEAAVMTDHVAKRCPKNTTKCADCGKTTKASDLKKHYQEDCAEATVACRYGHYGCEHTNLRKKLAAHEDDCIYKVVAVVGEKVKDQERQIERLQKQNQDQERQIFELKDERRDCLSWDDVFTISNVEGGPKFKPTEAVMTIYEDMERRMEELKKEFTDLEGRQTVMVLNQVMPIKDQITEIRSNLGILKMHMAWLMNKSREEVERSRLANRSVGGTSRTRGGSDSDGEASSSSRRLSDGSNGIPRL